MEKGKFFDAAFFNEAFDRLSDAFSKRNGGEPPTVELVLDDGTEFRVAQLVEAAEGWVSLLAYSGRDRGPYRKDVLPEECVQLTVPLRRIRRVVHRREIQDRIGFEG